MRILRRMKAEAALLIALADIGGVWPVARVTRALTDVADTALGAAVRYLLGEAAERGKLLPPDPKNPEAGSGYIVLAMGKMGGHELNFSSDIDLMVFFDRAAPALPPDVEPAPFYVRLTRDLVKLLQERTADGYVFRVDLRLRPDPSSTQIAISTDAGARLLRKPRTELGARRADQGAALRRRSCGRRTISSRDLSPFIWRKYLDYAAVADVHAMKQQIHAYRGHGEIAVEGHNIKLGRGGIREIEFFVQTQQLIAGGRHGELRGRGTSPPLPRSPPAAGSMPAARDELTAAYDFLRRVEHRLQMQADEQTHTLPSDPRRARRIRALSRLCRPRRFRRSTACRICARSSSTTSGCSKARPRLARRSSRIFRSPVRRRAMSARRSIGSREMGFRQPREVAAAVHRWHAGTYRGAARRAGAGKSQRACAGHHRPIRARGKSGCGVCRLRPLPRRPARRRPLPLAAAAKSGPHPLRRADPRRCAAARRYPGAAIRTSSIR